MGGTGQVSRQTSDDDDDAVGGGSVCRRAERNLGC